MQWLKRTSEAKVVFVHAGMSKTGTTSLQKMLASNQHLLGKYDLLYPKTCRGAGGAHHELNDVLKLDGDSVLEKTLLKEINDSPLKQIIVSSELFERSKPEHWKRLIELFSPHQVKVIYYLRRQDDAITSMYNELCKKHAVDLPFSEYLLKTPRMALLDYKKTLLDIENVIGVENMSIGVFSKNNLRGGDIGSDFMSRIMTPGQNLKSFATPHHNSSMLPATAMMMARINRHTHFNLNHALQYELACRLAHKINFELTKRKVIRHSYFSSQVELDLFREQFAQSNLQVENRYLSEGVLLATGIGNFDNVFDIVQETTLFRSVFEALTGEPAASISDPDELAVLIGRYWQTYLFENEGIEPSSIS